VSFKRPSSAVSSNLLRYLHHRGFNLARLDHDKMPLGVCNTVDSGLPLGHDAASCRKPGTLAANKHEGSDTNFLTNSDSSNSDLPLQHTLC
jgi:hypothetical protein